MMPNPNAFISYSREDAAWANALCDALKARGLDVFLDTQRVPAGVAFESKIIGSLSAAKHLVVLWSPFAKDSDWVNREIGLFEALQRDDPTRKIILVTLRGIHRAFASIQAVMELEPLYQRDPATVLAEEAWLTAVRRIQDAIDDHAAFISIPVVVLTMTEDDAVSSVPPKAWRELEEALGTDRAELQKRYGKTRDDWVPSGGNETIRQLLETLRLDIERAVPGQRFRWDRPDEAFWGPGQAPADYVNRFLNAPTSLLIIDPVAIRFWLVIQRLAAFQACLESARTAIAVLPPFPLPPQYQNLRTWIRVGATPYFDAYFDPFAAPLRRVQASCAFGGPDEVRRSLLVAVGQSLPLAKPAASGYLAH